MQDQAGDRKLLLFSVGPVACCADSFSIHRIIDPPDNLVHLPGRTHHPAIFRHEGRLVSVLDVRSLFGLSPDVKSQRQEKLIIAEIEAALYGFWVDEVQSILSAQDGKWGMLPGVVPRTLFDAAFHYKDQLVLHLDFAQLIHAEAIPWIQESGLYPDDNELAESEDSAFNGDIASQEDGEEKPNSAAPEQPASPPIQPHTKATEHRREPLKPVPAYKPPSRRTATTEVSSPKPGPKKESGQGQSANVPAPASRVKATPPPARTPTSEAVSIQHHPELPKSFSASLMAWLILVLVLCGVLLYFLWPATMTPVAKGTVSASRVLDFPTDEDVLPVSEPAGVKAEVDQAAVRETPQAQEVIQEPRAVRHSVPISAPEPDSGSEEETLTPASDALSTGPHATIEREGNTVTITLRENDPLISDDPSLDVIQPLSGNDDKTPGDQVTEDQPIDEEQAVAKGPAKEDERGLATQQESPGPEGEATTSRPVEVRPHARAEEIIHIVVKGDTLWDIAKRYIHDPFRYPELARLSNIENPDLIYPGDRVRILIIRY